MKTTTNGILSNRMWKPLLRILLLLTVLCFGSKMPNVQAQTVSTSVSHGNLIYEGKRGSAALYAADIHLLEEKISAIPERCFDPARYALPLTYEAVNGVNYADRYDSNTAISCQGCEEPEEPDASWTEEAAEEPDTPDTPETEEEPEEPGTPDPSETGDEPEEPGTPDPSETGDEPEEPETPDPPETGDTPEEPGTPDPFETGDEPEEPETFDSPETDDAPEEPNTPDSSGTDGVPGVTRTEDLGYVSGNRFVYKIEGGFCVL